MDLVPSGSKTSPRRLFVLAGMPRAGTTYVYHALARHPGVFVGARKECRYFSLNYNRGPEWYRRHFVAAGPDAILADLSPDYFIFDGVVERLRQFSWPPRVALAVRDPAAWAVSLHRHVQTLERRIPSFPEFLEAGYYPDFGRQPPAATAPAFAGRFISRRLQEFREAFGPDLLLYDFAFFERDPLTVMQALESFMGAPRWFTADRLPHERFNVLENRGYGALRHWLSREIVSAALARLLPRALLLRVRRWNEREKRPAGGPIAQAEDFRRDLALARQVLAPDIALVRSLFAGQPIVFGDGRPFGGPAVATCPP